MNGLHPWAVVLHGYFSVRTNTFKIQSRRLFNPLAAQTCLWIKAWEQGEQSCPQTGLGFLASSSWQHCFKAMQSSPSSFAGFDTLSVTFENSYFVSHSSHKEAKAIEKLAEEALEEGDLDMWVSQKTWHLDHEGLFRHIDLLPGLVNWTSESSLLLGYCMIVLQVAMRLFFLFGKPSYMPFFFIPTT